MWDLNYKHLHILFTVQVSLFCRCMGRSLLSVLLDAFPFDLTLPITSISPQFDGVRLRLENFPRIQWAIFCCEPFPGFESCVSLVGGMTQLTAALMKCEKLSKL